MATTTKEKTFTLSQIKTAIEAQLVTERKMGADYSQLHLLNSVMSDLLISLELSNVELKKNNVNDLFGKYILNSNDELEWVND